MSLSVAKAHLPPQRRRPTEGPAESAAEPSTANDPVVPPAPVDEPVLADAEPPAAITSVADAEVNDSTAAIEMAGRTPVMADADDLPEAQCEPDDPPAGDGELDPDEMLEWEGDPPVVIPNLGGRKRGTLSKPVERRQVLSPQQKHGIPCTPGNSGSSSSVQPG